MSRVTISMKAARAILGDLRGDRKFTVVDPSWAYDELRRAMEPKRKPPDAAGIALARELKRRANATRRAVGLPPLKSKRKPSAWEAQAKAARSIAKAQKRDRRASIREAVVKRAMDAGGLCECGCGEQVRDDRKTPVYPEARGEMDHFWGRGKGRPPESLETCWFLRPACHLAKTRNQPDARKWLQKYVAHCARYGYSQEQARATSRLAFVEARSMLGAGLRRTQ